MGNGREHKTTHVDQNTIFPISSKTNAFTVTPGAFYQVHFRGLAQGETYG
jgi:hypothetical protein